jgi:hypothetical protein
LIKNQDEWRWQQGSDKTALSASAAFVVHTFSNLCFGYLMIQRFVLIMMVISCLVV